MEYRQAEEHLMHADAPGEVAQIRSDLADHFVGGGVQTLGRFVSVGTHEAPFSGMTLLLVI